MPAKMPENRIQQPFRTTADIPVGGEAVVELFSLKVDLDRSCYLNPKGKILDAPEGMLSVKVRRERDGFHLYLNDDLLEFHPCAIGPEHLSKLIPVSSIHHA